MPPGLGITGRLTWQPIDRWARQKPSNRVYVTLNLLLLITEYYVAIYFQFRPYLNPNSNPILIIITWQHIGYIYLLSLTLI